ncbi:MFS general substrate transporter [Lineolata rhizophorae]|uniref:MFS general substrate transporter n=1 Tax=Lineolata rhizophorae TaxID=578093 RepID=A0A6A6P1X8_9PEZI|nr:MFS general substrate transporter [Lineolata rhizophorae]
MTSLVAEVEDNSVSSVSADVEETLDDKKEDSDPYEPPTAECAFQGHEDSASQRPISINNIEAIPNGGVQAWLQVVGSFFVMFNTWGVINTFGVFQTYYETELLPSSTPSAISWVGSLQAFLLLFLGAFAGPIYDAGYFRELMAAGSILIVFGTMMLSICKEYWQVLLAQGFCIGIGTGCTFVPGVAILSTYFTTKMATAMGIAAAGSSLGGVIYPILFHKLIPQVGFPWAARVMGFTLLATVVVTNLVMKVRVLPASRRKIIDRLAFRDPPFVLFVLGAFLAFMGLYAPFYYIQLYSIELNITGGDLTFYLLSIINAASVFGRVIPNFIADRTGPFNMMIPCAIFTGILALCLIPIRSIAPLIMFCLLYGFFSGAFVSLPPTILVHLSPSRGIVGTRMGMCFAIVSIGLLIGTPIGGAIVRASGFWSIWLYSGLLCVCGGALITAARVFKAGWRILKMV